MSEWDENQEQEQNAHQMRMQAARDEYRAHDLQNMVVEMNSIRIEKDTIEEGLKILNAKYDVLRIELIPSKMEEEGIEKITYEGIGRVSLTGDMNVRVIERDKFFDWLRTENLGDLIKEAVMPSTLKAFIKRRVKDGKEYPADLVRVNPFTRASITKG